MIRTDNEEIEKTDAVRRFRDALEKVLAELESRSIPSCAVTDEARRAVETRLYNLPRLYDELERADGLDPLLMSLEIRRVEKALEAVCGDEYFPLIPIRYFQNAEERQAAEAFRCDKATVWRNRKRLLDALAVRLMGTEAWESDVPPPSGL